MHILIAAIAVLLTTHVCALPVFGFGAGNGCLTKHSAYELVKNFIKLTNGDAFNENLANALIAENVVDTSGSVASIINGGMLTSFLKSHDFPVDLSSFDREHWSGAVARSNTREQDCFHSRQLRAGINALSAAQRILDLRCRDVSLRNSFRTAASFGDHHFGDTACACGQQISIPNQTGIIP